MKNSLLSKLIIALLMIVGTTTLKVNAQDYIFQESDGLVVMEAEHYFSLRDGSGACADATWGTATDFAGYLGSSYMKLTAENGNGDKEVVKSVGAAIYYKVNISTTGTYTWYARCSYDDGASDSYHLGLDDGTDDLPVRMNPATDIGADVYGVWGWSNTDVGGTPVTFTFDAAGEYTIAVYMREPNFRLDKIYLTLDDAVSPSTDYTDEDPGLDETASTGGATPVSEIEVSESMDVFPNPVVDNATVAYDVFTTGKVNISVYSLTGELVEVLVNEDQTAGEKQINWSVSGEMVKGIYFVKLTNGGKTLVKKIMLK